MEDFIEFCIESGNGSLPLNEAICEEPKVRIVNRHSTLVQSGLNKRISSLKLSLIPLSSPALLPASQYL